MKPFAEGLEGSQHTAGPCASTVAKTLAEMRKAFKSSRAWHEAGPEGKENG